MEGIAGQLQDKLELEKNSYSEFGDQQGQRIRKEY